jgi:ATP-binding protein involved in chromosome partitioning
MDKEKILLALKQIDHPAGLGDVVSLGKISSLVIKDDKIGFAINMDGDDKEQSEIISYNCKQAINSIYPQAKISIVLTKESAPKERSSNKPPINNVKKIIAISSCKGGVGKSTVTVNLAATLAKENYKIGLADLDIYGPSVPQMLGVKESPLIENNIMLPIEKYGIKSISFGNLIEAGKAAIWRGPMVTKALNQLLRNTNWQDIDILLLDLPPGTGDIHLSLLENYPINGVILVSTPQQVALIDLEKCITSLIFR